MISPSHPGSHERKPVENWRPSREARGGGHHTRTGVEGSLQTPVESVPKISKRIMPALRRLGIKTIRDLLFHFPSRYEDFSNQKSIRDIAVGEVTTISGKIIKISNRRTAKKHMFLTEATINDGTGNIKAIWFNQPFLLRNLRAGLLVNLSGKVALSAHGPYLQNPAHEKAGRESTHTGGLVAVYPETEGITSRWLRFLIKSFINLGGDLSDPLPETMRKKLLLPDIGAAILSIHFPKNKEETDRAQYRFGFERLLLIQLRTLRERLRLKGLQAPVVTQDIDLIKKFVHSLPYELTNAQRRSLWEIMQDISSSQPMNRILEGDVGSGKTVVAGAAALLAVKAGFKVALMAPTEILARQHYHTFQKILHPFNVRVGLLTGPEKKIRPDTPIFIGTHALIQKGITFKNLGLVIVDEQHRFGVEQRRALTSNRSGLVPHFLSMSATPIPRTLALTVYGDLDLSVLDEMPKHRKEIITRIVGPTRRQETYQSIRGEVKQGRQVFVICPRIELAESKIRNPEPRNNQQRLLLADTKAVKEEYKKLSETIFPDLRLGMLHGKMKSKEKDAVMRHFQNREIDILVSTSVVEVGVDVPNATVMLIEGAERFGLAQLHQFRGRVGRGKYQSYCFLFPNDNGVTTKRLRAVVEAKNGFELAEKDLEIRGPGDIFGLRQWGVPDIVLADITNHKLVHTVRQEAAELLRKDPALTSCPELSRRLETDSIIHLE